jgi:hypothetical protein
MSVDLKALKRSSKGATEYVGARLDPETKLRLESVCKAEGISVSSLVAELIKGFLDGYKGEPK